MMPPMGPQGPVPTLSQPDQRMNLASLLMPRAPSGGAPGAGLINPGKILSFMNMRDKAPQPVDPAAPPDLSGNVRDEKLPFGRLVNALAGSEGLFGSNGPLQQHFGAQPSAMNGYNGPAIGPAPISAMTMPGADPAMGIAPRWGG